MKYVITGILNKQIAAELKISEETVKIHRGRVMQKLGIVSVVELVHMSAKSLAFHQQNLPEGNTGILSINQDLIAQSPLYHFHGIVCFSF